MSRIAVLGGTGFVGRHLVDALAARSREVVVLSRRPPTGVPPQVEWRACDAITTGYDAREIVRDLGCDTLVMLAWKTTNGLFWHSSENFAWAAASIDLARRFADVGGRRIVGIGTCAEYDPPPVGACVPGVTAIAPRTTYGCAKAAVGWALEGLRIGGFCSTAWARLFHLFGPDEAEERLVPSIIRACAAGRPIELRYPGSVRDYLAVDACGRFLADLVVGEVEGAVNVCSGVPVTIEAIARRISSLTGSSSAILHSPPATPDPTPNLWGTNDATACHVTDPMSDRALRDTIAFWTEKDRVST